MKRCPKCNRTYSTNTQKFCTHDGGVLVIFEAAQSETIRIDSTQLDDAPTKAISRELPSEVAGGFDPFRTIVAGGRAADEETTQVRGRVTQDIVAPAETIQPPAEQPPANVPPSSSGQISQPPPQSSAPLPTQDQQTYAAPPVVDPRDTTAPLQTPAPSPPQYAGAPTPPIRASQPAKKSKLPLVLGILAVLLVLFVGVAAVGYFFLFKPWLSARRTVENPIVEPPRPVIVEPTPNASATPTDSGPVNPPQEDAPPYSPPADAVQFVNSNTNLEGKLAEHYIDFTVYYPERWAKDPKSGVPGATNFVEVHRQLPPNFTQESMAISWYGSAGSFQQDQALFSALVKNKSAEIKDNIGGYKLLSEGITRVGVYDGYEFRFEGVSQKTDKGQFKIWGRVIWLPSQDGGKNGITLLMLTTSLAPELKSVDDVGAKGELPMLLESFRFGKK